MQISWCWRGVGGEGAAPPPKANQTLKGLWTRGPRDQRTRGTQGTKGPVDQRTKGPEDPQTTGPGAEEAYQRIFVFDPLFFFLFIFFFDALFI